MGRFEEYKKVKHQPFEVLKINKAKKKISGHIRSVKYRDKDTRQMVVYIPSLQVSGYGATLKKANEMLKFSIDDLFQHLINLPLDQIAHEMSKLGWKKDKMKNKEFSQSYVDIDGNLKNFNAVNDEVEEELMEV